MKPLTPRQAQILTFIQEKVVENGYPPTVREIGEAMDMSSTASVHFHLKALEKKGYIYRNPSKKRAIKILIGGIECDN
ncbi:MarR family transcriptional regulator [Bacillus sp. TL12]|uniref:LexA family protein n=1 Tax=Bacillus sp. TL12 TaxID=2894756 RepID=UPI001F51A726|nr:MarR family transcriptional regulator [Bacillus sp. TL12]MCI0766074.1 MarR family transcriptional regulator [Bacillus sp. TL12]